MGNIIQIKRGDGAPASSSLTFGELGYDATNGVLYIGKSDGDSDPLSGLAGLKPASPEVEGEARAALRVNQQTYTSVTQIGLTPGAPTVNQVLSALPANSSIEVPVSNLVGGEAPESTGIFLMSKGASAADSFLLFFGKTSAQKIYRKTLNESNQFAATWYILYDGTAPVPIAGGGTASTTRVNASKTLLFGGVNTNFEDTAANWPNDFEYRFINTSDTYMEDKPSSYGMVVSMRNGDNVAQLWFTQPNGAVYHRQGNASGWGSVWRKFFDDSETLPVPNGGTGLATIGVGEALIGNGTSALTSRAITDNTSLEYLPGSSNLVTENTIRYWNGAYNIGGNSVITKLGAIDVGEWKGSVIDRLYGGTGVSATTRQSLLNELGFQMGITDEYRIPTGANTVDVPIVFPTPYPTGVVPFIVVCSQSNASNTNNGGAFMSVIEASKTNEGFTVRFYSTTANNKDHAVAWMAYWGG